MSRRNALVAVFAGLIVAGCATGGRGAPEVPLTHTAADVDTSSGVVAEVASREVLTVGSLVFDQVEVGAAAIGQNTFRVRIANRARGPVSVGVELSTIPGLWIMSGRQNQTVVALAPQETRTVVLSYQFRRLTPEGVLRLRVLQVDSTENSRPVLGAVLLERSYHVGRQNPAASDPRDEFEMVQTEHFDIYVGRGSLAQASIQSITSARENGLTQIEGVLGVRITARVRLVFYPDSATKTRATGHIGNGFAGGGNIVEIYNAQTQLNPYHEIAHIVGASLGDPPAFMDEGFATYSAELLGFPALRSLGHGEAAIDAVVCQIAATDSLVPFSRLFRFTEIGSVASRGRVAYPEAASIVKYMIALKGVDRFREAYRTLKRTSDSVQVAANEAVFTRIYGEAPTAFERSWFQALGCGSAPPRLRANERH